MAEKDDDGAGAVLNLQLILMLIMQVIKLTYFHHPVLLATNYFPGSQRGVHTRLECIVPVSLIKHVYLWLSTFV